MWKICKINYNVLAYISNYLGNEKIEEKNEIISLNQNLIEIFPEISQLVEGLPIDEFSILFKNQIDPIFKQIRYQ